MGKSNPKLFIIVLVAFAVVVVMAMLLTAISGMRQANEEQPPLPCSDVSMVHIYHMTQVGEWDRWEADAENAASVLVAKRMGGNLWERYQTVPDLQQQYQNTYQEAKSYTATSGAACVWAEQDALFQQLNATHMEIMTIYNDIVAADGNRR
ncbi:MAG: hypothetical protein VX730_06130 [Pseudomonadota bacterium]|nr:hypothetical protein [Pseudomonadota bacterium]